MVLVVAVRTIFRLEWVELTTANILQCLHSLSAKHTYILYMLMLYISHPLVSILTILASLNNAIHDSGPYHRVPCFFQSKVDSIPSRAVSLRLHHK